MIEQNLWADPRGAYAILALLVLGVLGAALAPGGWGNRRRRSPRLIAAAVLVGAALSLLWPQACAHTATRAAAASGTWHVVSTGSAR